MERHADAERDRVTELMDRVGRAHAAMCAAQAELLDALGELEASGSFPDDADTCVSAWAGWACGVSRARSEQWTSVARGLRELPEVASALRRGEVSFDKTIPLVRLATSETDEEWAAKATELSVAQLHRAAARAERERREDPRRDAHSSRGLRLDWDERRRLLYLQGTFAAEEGTALQAALRERARTVPIDPDADDPREARMADALVGLVTEPGRGRGGRPTVVVHADAEALFGGTGATSPPLAETQWGAQLADHALRRMACYGRIRWVAHAADGRAVGISRAASAVPVWMGSELWNRDGGCRFGGCGVAANVHAHHLVHWADGGPTDLENLVLLCGAHHRFMHEGEWTFSGSPYGELRFHHPTSGAVRTSVPLRGT